MTDDAWQPMLFGATTAEGSTEDGPADELRVCALNVNSPSPGRAQRIVDWLLATKSNTLVLTEMQPSDGGRHILACLQAEGFTTTCTPGWTDVRYLTVVATRGLEATRVQPAGFDPRIVAVDLATDDTTVRLVGVYGPTNGMTPESSHRRREFQHQLLDYLAAIHHPALCVAGDLNVIEPDHHPRLPAFEDHDYAFYTGLLDLGLRDAYRTLNPAGGDHSWINARFGNQRLDHTLISPGAGQITTCAYDHTPRSEDLSDHAALLTTLGLPSASGATTRRPG
ncbi:endonuclease/exonuclease/phosphatase family protein [Amycolatopsis sp. NPDC059021]|uniref:endonuclease/exonuclease/phosphatase family protein n=1 Tax=Amycolatopsis sp. NPDC059021 TaxID=3346704 RepID=UPI00366B7B82